MGAAGVVIMTSKKIWTAAANSEQISAPDIIWTY
jgi:hypothetical protein